MVQLYDQYNRPIPPTKKPETRELAVAPLLDSFREYVSDGLTPERLAAIFKSADAGDVRSQSELFGLLEERDGHVLCERDKRRNVVTDLDYILEPASDSARDNQVAEFCQRFFEEVEDWDENLIALQDAVGKGFSCLEINWDVSSGQAWPDRLDWLGQHRFLFTDERGMLSRTPRLLTDEDAMGVEIPAWKTIIHVYGGKSGSPTRSAIYRVCSWMVLFKNYSLKDWVIFCELFGMPLRLGKYATGATKADKDALYAAIRSIGSDAAGVISKETEIEFIESAKGSTASDLWERLANFCDAQISKSLLGQTLTAQVGDKGSYAASKTHNEVRIDLLKADGKALAGTTRNQLLRPLVGFNFGWDTPVPKYEAVYDEGEDLKAKADWVGSLMDREIPMSLKWLREEFNIPEPEENETIIVKSVVVPHGEQQPTLSKVVAKDKPGEPGTAAALTEKAVAEISMDGFIDPVASLLDGVDTIQELRAKLDDLRETMDLDQWVNTFAKALAVAELTGRFDVGEEIAGDETDG